jgi:hypothetical protein
MAPMLKAVPFMKLRNQTSSRQAEPHIFLPNHPSAECITRRPSTIVTLALTLFAAISTLQCGGSSNAPTSGTATVSGVALNATSVAVGGSAQGTVNLTAAAPSGGATISLSSSNPAVATVQSPVTAAAGSSSAAFTITGMGAGTATITASLNGSRGQSPTFTVSAMALSSISLSAASVLGGNSVTGTVTLTAAAPAGGAVVSLSSGDPIIVPASVTVPSGSTSATFPISTREVGGTISGTITGSYGGGSASAVLSVRGTSVATASFGVSGPTETETCAMTNNGNTINCTFNGSTSTAPGTINAYDWSYGVATTFRQTTSGPILTTPTVNCSLLPPPPMPAGVTFFTLTVTLIIHDDRGNVSPEAVNRDVRLFPSGTCGF